MPAAPRAASASPSEPVLPGRCAWGKRQRLLRAPEFAAFLTSPAPWRAARFWLAVSVITPTLSPASPLAPIPPASALRFGITVSRRQARRAVARNTVKRVLREAARHRAPVLEAALAGKTLDILFRLKAPLPDPATAGWAQVKAQLRREADGLLEQLLAALQSGGPLPGAAQRPRQSLAQSARGREGARTPVRGARPAPKLSGV